MDFSTLCIEMEDKFTLPSKKVFEEFQKQIQAVNKSLEESLATPLDRFSGGIDQFTQSVALFDLSMKDMVKNIQEPKKELMTFKEAVESPLKGRRGWG